jgi:ribonuclease VapC
VIVDSSALVALAFQEEGFEGVELKLALSGSSAIGTPTLAETGIVLASRLGRDPQGLLARMMYEFDIIEVPFGESHWREALGAHQRFGRGRHPASLNFGDCLTYAVASLAQEALLFVGGDFALTDLVVA